MPVRNRSRFKAVKVWADTWSECTWVNQKVIIKKVNALNSSIIFFNIVSIQFHTLFVAAHKISDSKREEGFRLFPNSCVHHFFHFFITAKLATM